MSHRTAQVESILRRTISEVLQRRISDPRIQGLVSITQVSVSPDLRNATVDVSVLPDKYEKRTIAGLKHASGHIQALVRKEVRLRTVPTLEFRLDESLKRQGEVYDAIQRASERTPSEDPESPEDEADEAPQGEQEDEQRE